MTAKKKTADKTEKNEKKATPAKAAKATKAKKAPKGIKTDEVVTQMTVEYVQEMLVTAETEESEEDFETSETGGERGPGAGELMGLSSPTAKKGDTAPGQAPKNFRHHPDMENFYRFICENDLRFEALAIIDKVLEEKALARRSKDASN